MDAEEWREAREKQKAESAARKRPPEKVDAAAQRAFRLSQYRKMPTTLAFAKNYGNLVLQCAQDAGTPEPELKRMRGRMNEWVKYLAQYEADVQSVNSMELDAKSRRELVDAMEATRESKRKELFGE